MSKADLLMRRFNLRYALGGLALAAAPALCASGPAGDEDAAADRAGYSAGYRFGSHLAGLDKDPGGEGAGIDLEAVFRGVLDALSGAEPRYSAEDMRVALEMLEMRFDAAPVRAREGAFRDDFAALNARRPGVVTLPSGVQYEVLRAGSGRQPQPEDTVAIHYQGSLMNGVVFDSTYDDEEPLRVKIAEVVVPGLREALLLMQENAQWRVVVPPAMGFGKAGNNQLRRRDLIYEVELLSVGQGAADGSAAAAQ